MLKNRALHSLKATEHHLPYRIQVNTSHHNDWQPGWHWTYQPWRYGQIEFIWVIGYIPWWWFTWPQSHPSK